MVRLQGQGIGPGRQRGAIGLAAVLLLVVVVVFLALALDAGRLYMEQRNLQRIADATALETAWKHTGCTADPASALQTAQAVAERNGYQGDDLVIGAQGLLLGRLVEDGVLRVFETMPDVGHHGVVPEAARVHVEHEVPQSLVLGGLFGQQATLSAEAVARRMPLVGISAGSWAARVDTENSPLLNALLNGLLGTNLQLDAVAFAGLVDTSVTLLQLAQDLAVLGVDLSVATVDELLSANVRLLDVLEAAVRAVEREGVLDVNASVLRNQLLNIGVENLELQLADILQVQAPSMDPDAALDAQVNVLDLIMTTAMTATRDHAVELDVLLPLSDLNLLNLVDVDARVKATIVEPPQIVIGPPGRGPDGEWRTIVDTAQVRLQAAADLSLNVGIAAVDVDLGVALQAAQGSAWVEGVGCPPDTPGATEVAVGTLPGVANLELGEFDDIAVSDPSVLPVAVEVRALGIHIATLALAANAPIQPAAGETLHFLVEDRAALPTEVQSVASGLGGALANGLQTLGESIDVEITLVEDLGVLATLLGLTTAVVEALVNEVVAILLSLVLPLVLQLLGSVILEPLLSMLGVGVGGLDVQVVELLEGGVDLVR
ncbi:TadG family pilus assembly protein [Alkalilimnicola ehrlichii MLHE-1]|uniref:DUF2134 domain-containing protein n=1 Tax=Alkalilimnicola ehrlichii (strain ATCC BAA-1101 / DSM 17681 / MLHE-1) TaxID=187272 RepID=Q0A6P0_ALKEH|nr:TadG family pilus assembly protein [Alkalilimnicola ehrlichii]ABI57497.1 conserved hypothetical protein [Alkalilimnicola ehrlichii MLHE-1]